MFNYFKTRLKWALILSATCKSCHGCNSSQNPGVLGAFWPCSVRVQNGTHAQEIREHLTEIWANPYPQSKKYNRGMYIPVCSPIHCAHIAAGSPIMHLYDGIIPETSASQGGKLQGG